MLTSQSVRLTEDTGFLLNSRIGKKEWNGMLRKMKWKFVAFVMACIAVLMAVVVGGINFFARVQMTEHYDQLLEILVYNGGEFAYDGWKKDIDDDSDESKKSSNSIFRYNLKITKETPFENRYFSVFMDEEGNVNDANVDHISAITASEAEEYAKDVFVLGRTRGTYDTFRYIISENEDGYIVGFIDMYQHIQNNFYIEKLSILLSGSLYLILFVIIYLASGKALAPIVQNMEKQKQFITDAGHELKTPLAVISADVDVIELTAGKSEWTDSIRKQTVQMSELIKHLLFLSKMEEKYELVMEEINLSQISKDVADRISAIAVSQNKRFRTDIQDDIMIKGDRSGMEHLVSVLTENAVKYCSDEGEINLKLYKNGKKVHLEVRNTGEPLDEKMIPRLFDRFYRPDESRTREKGGHGIGLSIAKAIVTAHKGKIGAHNEKDNVVAFTVEL